MGNYKELRKYQCFVCGQEYDSYEEYKSHILSDHDEGREFLKCPHCNGPVRDMKAHFALDHRNRVLPNDIQLRVGVWHDFKGGKRKTKKPAFKQGNYDSDKMKTSILYRSGYEKTVYELLDQDAEVAAFYAEPFKVPYNFGGKWLDYIPDIKIQYTDGRVDVWEVKPANQTGYIQNKAKWSAMNEYAKKMGWDFTVITEVGINKLRNKIKQQCI
jgi:DNA-directed RNA polymerase subunit RPC12/RpoP